MGINAGEALFQSGVELCDADSSSGKVYGDPSANAQDDMTGSHSDAPPCHPDSNPINSISKRVGLTLLFVFKVLEPNTGLWNTGKSLLKTYLESVHAQSIE